MCATGKQLRFCLLTLGAHSATTLHTPSSSTPASVASDLMSPRYSLPTTACGLAPLRLVRRSASFWLVSSRPGLGFRDPPTSPRSGPDSASAPDANAGYIVADQSRSITGGGFPVSFIVQLQRLDLLLGLGGLNGFGLSDGTFSRRLLPPLPRPGAVPPVRIPRNSAARRG